jgi:hypothetical protein
MAALPSISSFIENLRGAPKFDRQGLFPAGREAGGCRGKTHPNAIFLIISSVRIMQPSFSFKGQKFTGKFALETRYPFRFIREQKTYA